MDKIDFKMVRGMENRDCLCYLCKEKKATHKTNGQWKMANGQKTELYAYLCPACMAETLKNKNAEFAIVKMEF